LSLLFSKSHDRVLLIDGDVHRPRLHKALGVEGGVGLAQVLKDEAAFDDVVRRGIGGSLDFLPAGHCEDLAEVVQPERAAALLEMLKSRYALIVIDSPPALAVADTRILARLADHVVYLVRWNATPRDAVRNGVKLLRGAGVRLSGIVLSQVNQRKHSKYGYGDYGQYYGRYRQYYGG
ncbi:MAG TPA: CpsD/CapB family tyrosine-protein kinase, partial [Alphaproteobacteria bacterium]|nr:CpsD/CapB family tyrosine-protein kinase [Alphaproteobacteria bacterium]